MKRDDPQNDWRHYRFRFFVALFASFAFFVIAEWTEKSGLKLAYLFSMGCGLSVLTYALVSLGKASSAWLRPSESPAVSPHAGDMTSILQAVGRIPKQLIRTFWWLIPLAFTTGIFWVFYEGYLPLKGNTIEQRGQFGDSFGVLNALFTGLGFGGLVVTLILQQRQLSQQETEIGLQRQSDETRHYQDTLHRLLALYAQTLSEVSDSKGTLRARSVLRGSTDRALEAIKREKAHLVPLKVQERYSKGQLTQADRDLLDYRYFRNFKILTVEIDRQGRLTDTLKVLLKHLVHDAPNHLSIETYKRLVCAQITYVEVSYFFLVALTFSNEGELRDSLLSSGLLEKAAYVKRLKIHDYMYEQFWGQNIRKLKQPQYLPISEARINNAVRAYRRNAGTAVASDLTSYTSPRVRHDSQQS